MEYSSPYCDVLHRLNVRQQKYLVCDIHATKYVAVLTAASTDGCQAPRYDTLILNT